MSSSAVENEKIQNTCISDSDQSFAKDEKMMNNWPSSVVAKNDGIVVSILVLFLDLRIEITWTRQINSLVEVLRTPEQRIHYPRQKQQIQHAAINSRRSSSLIWLWCPPIWY